MLQAKKWPALDCFRLVAAIAVAAIHTSPLQSLSPQADTWLCRVLARLAVPFFFMITGYFLAQKGWRGTGRFLKRTAFLYGAAVLLYLPLNWYAGGFGFAEGAQKLLLTGTFYHLWYLPAVLLGVPLARLLCRPGLRIGLPVAAALYLVGLAGDSWYGIAAGLPWLKAPLDAVLWLGGGYTRNGLFFAPLFILLGAAARPVKARWAVPGLVAALAAMSGEAALLRGVGSPKHDSMYLLLPVCAVCLFGLLLGQNRGRRQRAAQTAGLVYILHPWCIVLVRGAAKALRCTPLLVENSLVHFAAVTALSLAVSAALAALQPRRPDPTARAWRQIDLTALVHNAALLKRQLARGCGLMAVVKADGYGHGAAGVARALQKQGVRHFAVASLAEGVALRKRGVRGEILVLGYTPPWEAPVLARWRISQTLVSEEYALALAATGCKLHAHLALDSGMHRLGLPTGDTAAALRVFDLPGLKIRGVFSHLCVADSLQPADVQYTLGQAKNFYSAVERLRAAGRDPGLVHLQASYGVLNLPPQPCGLARVGIALYGAYSENAPVQRRLELWPALALKARVAQVRTLLSGESAGYGLAFTAARPTRLAVVSIGYADGLPRDLADRGGQVLVRGRRVPVVGRLCMDQLLADVTEVEGAAADDQVTLIGRDGAEEIRAEELAEVCGTITNELLAGLSSRLGLVYQGG